MSHQGLIVGKSKGFDIPKHFIDACLLKFPTCMGLSGIMEGELRVETIPPTNMKNMAQVVEETCKAYKDNELLFYFSNYPDGVVQAEDQQPYVVLNADDGKNLVVAHVQGQYPGHIKQNSARAAEGWYTDEFLVTKIEELYELIGKDMKRLVAAMQRESFRNDLMSGAVGDSTVTLMCSTGDILRYEKGKIITKPFGWCTLDPEVTVTKAADPAPAPDKKLSAAERRKQTFLNAGTPASTPAAPAPAPTPAPQADPKPVEPPKTDTSATAVMTPNQTIMALPQYVERHADGTFWFHPPQGINHKSLKRLYNTIAGYLPNGPAGTDTNWHAAKPCRLSDTKTQKLMTTIKGDLSLLGQAVEAAKDKPLPDGVHAVPTKVEGPSVPVISAAAKQAALSVIAEPKMKSAMDDFSNKLKNPTEIQAMEEEVAQAHEMLGKNFDELLAWPLETWKAIASKNEDCLNLVLQRLQDVSFTCIKLQNASGKKGAKVTETDKHVLANQELKPMTAAERRRAAIAGKSAA